MHNPFRVFEIEHSCPLFLASIGISVLPSGLHAPPLLEQPPSRRSRFVRISSGRLKESLAHLASLLQRHVEAIRQDDTRLIGNGSKVVQGKGRNPVPSVLSQKFADKIARGSRGSDRRS